MVGLVGIRSSDDDELAARPHDVDRCPVERREGLGGEHLVRGAEREAPVGDVEDAIHPRQDRVDVVGDQQHRGIAFPTVTVDQSHDGLLIREVEAGQRLVAQQQRGVVGEGLADAEPLLLAAREQPDRAIGEFGSVVLIGGAIPGKTEVSSQWIRTLIENDDRTGAAAISIVLLVISFVVLFVLRAVGSYAAKREELAK